MHMAIEEKTDFNCSAANMGKFICFPITKIGSKQDLFQDLEAPGQTAKWGPQIWNL